MITYHSPDPITHAPKAIWVHYLIHPMKWVFTDGTLDWDKHKIHFSFYNNLFNYSTDLIEVDYVFLPFTLNYYIKYKKFDLAKELYAIASLINKPLVIWIDGDYDVKHHFEKAIYLKNASYKSKAIQNEIIRPGDVSSDLIASHCNGNVVFREKKDIPVVGFTGLASYKPIKLLGLILRNIYCNVQSLLGIRAFEPPAILPWFLFRKKVLTRLLKSKIDCQFNIRESFAVGVKTGDSNQRCEFLNNIINTDYTLCIRGASNYSIRFYETLCLGRIPILIDTDCKLPLEDLIDWDSCIIRIDWSELDNIAEKILSIHQQMSKEEFISRQIKCRQVWLDYLSNSSFPKFIFDFPTN
jgi:hypothetical protein